MKTENPVQNPQPLIKRKEAVTEPAIIYHPSGAWLCPQCKLNPGTMVYEKEVHPTFVDSIDTTYWNVRGYHYPPSNLPPSIPTAHPKYGGNTSDAIKDNLYFLNPSSMMKCHNDLKKGVSGSSCKFARSSGQSRIPEGEIKDNWNGYFTYYCTACAIPESQLEHAWELDEEFQKKVKRGGGPGECVKMGAGEYNIWGFPATIYARKLVYNPRGQYEKCQTTEYARGHKDSKAICGGKYGAAPIFYLGTSEPREWKPWASDKEGNCAFAQID